MTIVWEKDEDDNVGILSAILRNMLVEARNQRAYCQRTHRVVYWLFLDFVHSWEASPDRWAIDEHTLQRGVGWTIMLAPGGSITNIQRFSALCSG